MSQDKLQQAIRSRCLPPVIYLYGEETFLLQKALKQIEQAVLSPGTEDFNRHVFSARGINIEQVLDAARTLPAFAERRLVVIRDAAQLNVAELEALSPYIDEPVAETCMVLCGEKIDSRRKFFLQLKKKDALFEFKTLNEKQLPGFIRGHLDEFGFSITGDALGLFIGRVGVGLFEVMTELEKMMLYAGSSLLLDVPEVQAVVSSIRAENIFDIGNAVARQNPGKALALGRHLVADGEAPLKILALLTRHYRQLWKIREMQVEGRSTSEIARGAGVPPFVVDGLIAQGRRYSRADFRNVFQQLVGADLAMKSSGSQPEAVLEQLLLRLAEVKAGRN